MRFTISNVLLAFGSASIAWSVGLSQSWAFGEVELLQIGLHLVGLAVLCSLIWDWE